jgi:hypothetical protein
MSTPPTVEGGSARDLAQTASDAHVSGEARHADRYAVAALLAEHVRKINRVIASGLHERGAVLEAADAILATSADSVWPALEDMVRRSPTGLSIDKVEDGFRVITHHNARDAHPSIRTAVLAALSNQKAQASGGGDE